MYIKCIDDSIYNYALGYVNRQNIKIEFAKTEVGISAQKCVENDLCDLALYIPLLWDGCQCDCER